MMMTLPERFKTKPTLLLVEDDANARQFRPANEFFTQRQCIFKT